MHWRQVCGMKISPFINFEIAKMKVPTALVGRFLAPKTNEFAILLKEKIRFGTSSLDGL
jgi:hypothetical protein